MEINLPKFTGPFGLLLQLIEKEELDITEISLAKIAAEYVEYIKNTNLAPEAIADFLLIAAKLLYIKSRALLPYLATPEEDEDINELQRQLRMYKEYLEATKVIEKMLAKKKFAFTRSEHQGKNRRRLLPKGFYPPLGLTPTKLQEAFGYLLENFAVVAEEMKEEVLAKKISIDERIDFIRNELIKRIKFNFSKIISSGATKTEVIVNFLALLELAKQRELLFEQDELFSDIIINKI